MRIRAYFLYFLILISSCTILSKSDLSKAELFSINSEPVLAEEFMYVYEKNNFNNEDMYTAQDVDEYARLYVNFKLKVSEAKALGLDTTEAFIKEYTSYKDQLIKPYLTEAKEQERLVEEAYDRMKYEIDASHILITVDQQAEPKDTVIAYQKIAEIYSKAKNREDFGTLAKSYSEDPSAKMNGGRLGYFSAFQMVLPFEDAAYNTAVNSISDIIRSRFGYHILKVHDKRPYSGQVKVSHIMLRSNPNGSDSVTVRNKIFEIHDQVTGGADWNELCRKYSEDQRTKNNGGTLPFIGLRQINDAAFENTAFGLEQPGEISDPVRSQYGWHIIKLEEKKGLEPLEEIRKTIEERLSSGERSGMSRAKMISRLKSQNNFMVHEQVRNLIIESADSTILAGKWQGSISEKIKKDTLFQIGNKQYLVAPAIAHIVEKQGPRLGVGPKEYMSELIDSYIEQSLLQYEEEQLISTNREVGMLLQEYYEGILLFDIMNSEVWEKAGKDTLGLRTFFEENQESYYWGKRAKAAIFSSPKKETIMDVGEVVDQNSYLLFETNVDLLNETDLLDHEGLDTLLNLFNAYENNIITIEVEKHREQQEKFRDVLKYFDAMGIADSLIEINNRNAKEHKILLQLNSSSKKSLEYLYNKESALNLQVVEQLFERGDNQILDSIPWEKGIYELKEDNSYILVKIDEILEEQAKELKDVKGLVISDYQNYLEKNWLDRLRSNNTIRINHKTFDQIKKTYSKRLGVVD